MEPPKPNPDPIAQAAELKKKLLEKRKSGSRDTSAAPSTPVKNPFVPHPMPRPPSHTSVPARSEDIDALIKAHSQAGQINIRPAIANVGPPKQTTDSHIMRTVISPNETSASSNIRPTNDVDTKGKMLTSPTKASATPTKAATAPVGAGNSKAAIGVSDELFKLLENDTEDLHEWLQLTGYFDKQARKKKIARSRSLAEVEAEERRIKEREAKIKEQEAKIKADQERIAAQRRRLMEEDGIDGFIKMPSQTPQPTIPIETKDTANTSDKNVVTATEQTTEWQRNSADERGIKRAADKVMKLEDRVSSTDFYKRIDRKQDDDHTAQGENSSANPGYRQRSRSRQRERDNNSGRTLAHRSASPPAHRNSRQWDDADKGFDSGSGFMRSGYDSYRGGGSAAHDDTARDRRRGGGGGRLAYPEPKPVDLGGRGGQFSRSRHSSRGRFNPFTWHS